MVGINGFEVTEGDFSEGAGAGGGGEDGEQYKFVIREGKGAWVKAEYREIDGADKVEDVSFVMGWEGDMLGEIEIVQ